MPLMIRPTIPIMTVLTMSDYPHGEQNQEPSPTRAA